MRLLDNIQDIMTRTAVEKKMEGNKTFTSLANSSYMKFPKPTARTESMLKYPKTKDVKNLEKNPKNFLQ